MTWTSLAQIEIKWLSALDVYRVVVVRGPLVWISNLLDR